MGVDTWKIGTKIRMWDVRSLSTQKLVCAPVCLSTKTNHTRNSGLPQFKKKRTSRKRATRQKWGWWCSVRQDQLPYQAKHSIDQCTCMQGMYWGLRRTHTVFFVLKTSQIEYSVVDCIQRYVKWNCSWMCHKTHSQLTLLFHTTITGDMIWTVT